MDRPNFYSEGDVVVFNSGGPNMTVRGTRPFDADNKENQQVVCGWFLDGEYFEGEFDAATIQRIFEVEEVQEIFGNDEDDYEDELEELEEVS